MIADLAALVQANFNPLQRYGPKWELGQTRSALSVAAGAQNHVLCSSESQTRSGAVDTVAGRDVSECVN